MDKIPIKLVGMELSGIVYVTKRGSYVIDINFSEDGSNTNLHAMSPNSIDGEPDYPVKDHRFVIVKEFDDDV